MCIVFTPSLLYYTSMPYGYIFRQKILPHQRTIGRVLMEMEMEMEMDMVMDMEMDMNMEMRLKVCLVCHGN